MSNTTKITIQWLLSYKTTFSSKKGGLSPRDKTKIAIQWLLSYKTTFSSKKGGLSRLNTMIQGSFSEIVST